MDITLILVAVIVLVLAAFIRSLVGFGESMLAMPALMVLLGAQTATPVMALIATTISGFIVIKNFGRISFRPVIPLILFTILGIPLGLWLLMVAPDRSVRAVLGTLILIYGLYGLSGFHLPHFSSDKSAPYFGLLAGVFGGAYNTNGPVVVIYAALKRWPPEQFRLSLQGYFFVTNLFILISHAYAGLWTIPVVVLWLSALVPVVLAIWLGDVIFPRIDPKMFGRIVYGMLSLIGVALLVR